MGYVDELSIKLTAKDAMSATLRDVKKEMTAVVKEVGRVRAEFEQTGSAEAAAELKKLSTEYDRLARKQAETAKAQSINKKSMDELRRSAGTSTTAMGRLGAAVTKHATAIRNAGLVAGAAALLFAKQSISAYADAEKQQAMLTQAYARFPKLNDVTRASFDDLNMSLMTLTGTDDDAIAGAEALLARFDLTGKQIQEIMPLINDYAIATSQDIGSSASTIGKAMLGNAKALKSMGINYKATGDRAKDYTAILGILERQVGGVGAAFGETTAGKLAILNASYDAMKETVGEALVPALQMLVAVVKPLVAFFTALPGPAKQAVMVLGAIGIAAMIATPRILAMSVSLKGLGFSFATLAPLAAALPWIFAAAAPVAFAYWMSNLEMKTKGATMALVKYKDATSGATYETKAYSAQGSQAAYETLRQRAAQDNLAKSRVRATDATTEASKKESAAMFEAARAGQKNADAMAKVTYFTSSAAVASARLAGALQHINDILNRDDAIIAWKKALKDNIAKPSIDATKTAIRAFTSAAATMKSGGGAQARFTVANYATLRKTIMDSGMSAALKKQLLTPLTLAKNEAQRVLEVLALMDGKVIKVTYSGGTVTNPGGVHAAEGGPIRGPGTGTSDSIPAMLSNGEYVIRAAAAKSIGYGTLDRLNIADRMPALPAIVNAPRITMPAGTGRDAPLIGSMTVYPSSQVDMELALAREARRQDRDRRTRMAEVRR